MPPELLSFLSKLPDTNTSYNLLWQSKQIDTQYKILNNLLPSLPFSKLIVLAIFLQYLDISIFTTAELNTVASLKLELVVATTGKDSSKKTLNKNKPIFDSNSGRVYSQVDYSSISLNSRYKELSTLSYLNYSTIKEIILNLYNGVY